MTDRCNLPAWGSLTIAVKLDLIRAPYLDGLSAGLIAARISAGLCAPISKNAVIGMINRHRDKLGVPPVRGRKRPNGPRPSVSSRRRRSAPVTVAETGLPAKADDLPVAALPASCAPLDPAIEAPVSAPAVASDGGGEAGVSFHALRARSCRFPLWRDGPPQPIDAMRFCGADVHAEGSSWCAAHLAIVAPLGTATRSAGRSSRIRQAFARGASVQAIATEHGMKTVAVQRVLEGGNSPPKTAHGPLTAAWAGWGG